MKCYLMQFIVFLPTYGQSHFITAILPYVAGNSVVFEAQRNRSICFSYLLSSTWSSYSVGTGPILVLGLMLSPKKSVMLSGGPIMANFRVSFYLWR